MNFYLGHNSFSQKGIIPLFFIIAAVIIIAGGAYALKSNIISTKNEATQTKNSQEAKNSTSTSSTPQPKKEWLAEKSTEYKPSNGEPEFSITPPSGWIKSTSEGKVKITYEGSQEDKKEFGNGGFVSSAPNIQVTVEKSANINSLDDAVAEMKSQNAKNSQVKVTLLTEKKTTLNGLEAYYSEFLLGLPNVNSSTVKEYLNEQGKTASTKDIEEFINGAKTKAAAFLLFKDGYAIGLSGVALESAWEKRSPAIFASFNSFKFLDNSGLDKTEGRTTAGTTKTNSSPKPVQSTGKPIEVSDYKTVFGSKEELSWRNPSKLKPPIPFSMKEPLNWRKGVPSASDNKSYLVEYEGDEESQEGKNGTVLTIRPIITVTMNYNPYTDLETEIKKFKASTEITSEKTGVFFTQNGYFAENTYEDFKTGVLSRTQQYIFYQNKYVIKAAISSLDSTWDKWQPEMKKIIDSFKFL